MSNTTECAFHDATNGKCTILTRCFCDPEENTSCSFRKTWKEYKEQRDKCIMRCRNLKMCRKDIRCRYGDLCYTTEELKDRVQRWDAPNTGLGTVKEGEEEK